MDGDGGVWVTVDGKLKYVAPLFLGLLVVYLYASLVSPVLSKTTLGYFEVTIVAYFVSELVVKYVISENYRQFLRDYWLDIILLVPFFKSLRLLGAVGKALKSIKALAYTKYVQKAVKIPKMARKTRFFSEKPEKGSASEKE